MKHLTGMLAALLLCTTSACILACSGAQQIAIANGVGHAVECVLEHDTDPPETIAIECGIKSVPDVIQILKASNRAAARKSACPPADAGAARDILYGPGK